MFPAVLAVALAILLTPTPGFSQTEWVREEIRINMRAGPGLQYKILKVLHSGDRATRLASHNDWIQIRIEDRDGWVPAGYLTKEIPAGVELPKLREELAEVQTRNRELDEKLGRQTTAIEELETLRSQNEVLTAENTRLSWSAMWRNLVSGALIVIVGIVIGVLIPRGGSASRTRLKL